MPGWLLTGSWAGIYLLGTLAVVMFIGTIYSTPPLRLKTRPGWAALSIALARGLTANAGLYLYFQQALAPQYSLSWGALACGLSFFFLLGVVIALYKDIPDWVGDQKYQVYTFAVVLGRERVFRLGRGLLRHRLRARLGHRNGENGLPGPGGRGHAHIRRRLEEAYGKAAADYAIILYGGSVKPANSYSLFRQEDIDGFLVGGASLDADGFVGIVREALRAYREET